MNVISPIFWSSSYTDTNLTTLDIIYLDWEKLNAPQNGQS